jgi:DNA repair protein RadA/Sms
MEIYPLNEISSIQPERYLTGLTYFDNILDGGLVASSTMIMAGTTGAGKSSLLTQVSYKLAENGRRVLYIAGEENKEQIKMRADRLGVNSNLIFLYEEVEVEKVIEAMNTINPEVTIVDSLQMLYSKLLKPAPATPSQMKYGLMTLCKVAKDKKITVIFVGHATKGGYIAGLQTFQHMVDTVLYLGINEDDTRFIKVNKNRFGQTGLSRDLYMSKYGLFDRTGVTKPFGQEDDFLFSLEDIDRITQGKLVRPIIISSYNWLKEKLINNPDVKLCNGTATITSSKIKEITDKYPLRGSVVNFSLNWLEKHPV